MYDVDVREKTPNWRILGLEVVAAAIVAALGAIFHQRVVIVIAVAYAFYMAAFTVASLWKDTLFGRASVLHQHLQFMRFVVILGLIAAMFLGSHHKK